jgi:hypothetical protein
MVLCVNVGEELLASTDRFMQSIGFSLRMADLNLSENPATVEALAWQSDRRRLLERPSETSIEAIERVNALEREV